MKKILIILIITLILISGCSLNKNRYEYNGYTVIKHQYGWTITTYAYYPGTQKPVTKLINLRYGPKELEHFNLEQEIKDIILDSKQIFITTNPNESGKISIATIEIGKILGTASWGVFKIPTKSALTEPTGNITVKTCNDANEQITVILLKTGNQTKQYSQDNCIILEGQTEDDVIKLADRLALNLLGVM